MSRAKQILITFSVLIVVISGGLLWRFHTVNKAQNKELNSIVEPMIRDLVSSKWSAEVVYNYASPRLKQMMEKNWLVMTGKGALPLWTGNITEYDGVQGVYFNTRRNVVLVSVQVTLDYNNIFDYIPCGYSDIMPILQKNDEKWSLDGFEIDSPIGQYSYGFVEDVRVPPLEDFLALYRWLTGSNLRPGCLFSPPYRHR